MERRCLLLHWLQPSVVLLFLSFISSCGGGASAGNGLETEKQCTDSSLETTLCSTQESSTVEDSPCQQFTPEITIDFPPKNVLVPTDSVTVIGDINEAECVSSIEISGVKASIDTQTNIWQAKVPLSLGINTISVNVSGVANEKKWKNNESINVDYQGEILVNISAISNDVSEGQILAVAEDINGKCNIYRLNKVTGLADILSEEMNGAENLCFGNGSVFVNKLAVTRDGSRAFTMSTNGHLVEINLQTGIRSIIANDIGRGRLTGFNSESEVYYVLKEESGSVYLLYGVDINTGAINQITNSDNSYPSYSYPKQLEVHAASNKIFIADSNNAEVVIINADTGESSLYASLTKEYGLIEKMVLDEINDYLYIMKTSHSSNGITNHYYRLDITTKTLEPLNSIALTHGDSGPVYTEYQDAFYDYDSDCFYSLSSYSGNHRITCTKLSDAEISIIPEPSVGTGVDIYNPGAYVFDKSNLKNYVYDSHTEKLIETDIQSGKRSFLPAPSENNEVILDSPQNLQLNNSTNEIIMMSYPDYNKRPRNGVDELIGINFLTGDRRVISSENVGSGPELDVIVGAALSSDEQDLYLLSNENGFNGIMKINLYSGDRSIIYSHSDSGSLNTIAFDDIHNRLLFCDKSGPIPYYGKIFSFDIVTGEESVFIESADCSKLTIDLDNNRLLQSMSGGWLRIRNLDTGEIESSIFHPTIDLYSVSQSDNINTIYGYSRKISALVVSHTISNEVVILSR